MITRFGFPVLLALSFLFAACLREGDGGDGGVNGQTACEDDLDCPEDWHCIGGYCHSGECIHGDTEDPGGGCPPGFYCSIDESCHQDCVTDEQCVEVHGLFWECDDYGRCVYAGSDGGA